MSILNRAKEHYAALADMQRTIRVAEWDEEGDPCILYYKPLTLRDKAHIRKFAKSDIELAVETIILKCRDADGKPVFTREHKQALMREVDAGIIDRIATEIVGEAEDIVFENYEKN